MGDARREGARAKTTNVEFYTIILSFLIMTISSRQHCRFGAGKKGVTFDTCCTITQRSSANTGNLLLKIDRRLNIDGKKSCLLLCCPKQCRLRTRDKHVGFRISYFVCMCGSPILSVWQSPYPGHV